MLRLPKRSRSLPSAPGSCLWSKPAHLPFKTRRLYLQGFNGCECQRRLEGERRLESRLARSARGAISRSGGSGGTKAPAPNAKTSLASMIWSTSSLPPPRPTRLKQFPLHPPPRPSPFILGLSSPEASSAWTLWLPCRSTRDGGRTTTTTTAPTPMRDLQSTSPAPLTPP